MATVMNLSIKQVPAVNGAIGIQTLADGKPYSRQGAAIYDHDDNGYHEISVGGKLAVIINGELDESGLMQTRGV
ncbi:hypothetical protein ACTXLW_00615 [Psychrobacter celer]|uniref:hypothetical protein n=1 Tax=Psychrobacter celer TaxID=306572 RepID=UPI003FD57B8E